METKKITLEKYLNVYSVTIIRGITSDDIDYIVELFNNSRDYICNWAGALRISVTGEQLYKYLKKMSWVNAAVPIASSEWNSYNNNIKDCEKYTISMQEFKNRISNLTGNCHIDNVLVNM